ncbi:hypothetical protein E3O55_03450 [Cryobacterium sp. MDB1-18-2]|uniref:hypothetical protein n=1 Tax=unclassified Cryobacterium TaxID=2649013 RepID=UPI001068FFD9|nr:MULTISPECIES: hypothetical protein [unclassified Cryobacterium]MEB0001918.1 hypothetical protein [Cryobacterium sp. RTC2.1]MEB0287616.1 hypothetical protein [Cryobacterium sp. 10S3]MEB0305487.1 hypothetical protein [Cryobacterium sp. 10I1]TFC33749.1 hypothetical protein E3O55_03450 [Cryobacterium sp. MDB1-18-2]TFC40721.1 hypothetical protein E3O50_12335 [Cryobacterium sp. MDB1-18-1]
MEQRELFLQSDAALRSVIDRITPEQLTLPAPAEWTSTENPTIRDILAAHARDEAWVGDVLAGHTIEEVGDRFNGDLLGGDPIASYNRLNDEATAAVRQDLDPAAIVHLQYGDYPLAEYLQHTSIYRAFQAWSIANYLGLEYALPAPLVDLLWEQILPQVDDWRQYGVFPPEVEVPADADKETRLLGTTGFWKPSRSTD